MPAVLALSPAVVLALGEERHVVALVLLGLVVGGVLAAIAFLPREPSKLSSHTPEGARKWSYWHNAIFIGGLIGSALGYLGWYWWTH